jgi:pSer/pThr/pTyr-binding forkhead associated (FHA) protein
MADVPVLVCTSGELAGKRIPVPEGGLGIGRSPENTVVIHDEGVSRYHGRLLFDNGSLWLQDAGSRNGVFVNGARVTGHKALKVGDSITIAQHTFELRWPDEDEESSRGDATSSPREGSSRDGSASSNPASSRDSSRSRRASTMSTAPPASNPASKTNTKPPESTPEPPRRRWFWPFS